MRWKYFIERQLDDTLEAFLNSSMLRSRLTDLGKLHPLYFNRISRILFSAILDRWISRILFSAILDSCPSRILFSAILDRWISRILFSAILDRCPVEITSNCANFASLFSLQNTPPDAYLAKSMWGSSPTPSSPSSPSSPSYGPPNHRTCIRH